MSDTLHILNVQQTEASSPILTDQLASPARPPLIRDLSHEEQHSSSRVGLVRRDTVDDKSSASRRSSVDTLKSNSRKRMSLNVASNSPIPQPRRISRFRDGNEPQLKKSPTLLKQKSIQTKHYLRASPTLNERNPKARRTLRSRSTKELDNQSVNSRSFSELEDLQNLYHKQVKGRNEPTSNILSDLSPNAAQSKKISMQSRVTQMYYQMLRKKITRSGTQVYPDTSEFVEQIQEIKDNLRTPNAERIRDLVIVDKNPLEKLKIYQDKYPLLKFRKALIKIKRVISLVANKIITHPVFDYFILCVIIANSIILALDDPTVAGTGSEEVDNLLLAIYTCESVIKILGMGFFFNKGAYLRDLWNIMDFVIVVTGYIPILLASDGVNLQAFRALRVLRPLRTISNIEALRVLIQTLVGAFGPLMETLFILFFVFLIFAIGGLQLFSGMLKKRCFSIDTGIPMEDEEEDGTNFEKFCNIDDDCPTGIICGKMVKNPNFDITNFDTLQNSFLMVFQIVTLEGWSDIMYYLDKTFTPITSVYFIVLIVICAFFLLNLTLAVLKVKFTENTREEVKAKNLDEKYWVHGEKFFNKIEHSKREVLKLMEKRKRGEIEFNKYEFKRENLTAVDTDKAHTVKTGVSRKRRRADAPGKLSWLQHKVLNKIMTNNPAAKGFAAIVSLVKKMKSNSTLPDTERNGSIVKSHSVKTETANTATPQILITAKTKSLKKSDTRPDTRGETKGEANPQVESPIENLVTEKPDPNSTSKPLLAASSPLSSSMQKDFTSPMRPMDSSRLLITPVKEKSPSRTDASPGIEHHVNGTPSLVIIPSIAEANEKSEHSLGGLTSKNFLGVQRNNFMSNNLKVSSPIRPLLAEKVHIKANGAEKTDSVALINIAGIRNKGGEQRPKSIVSKGTYVFDATPVHDSKEVSFNDEHSVFDLLDAKSPIGQPIKPRNIHSQNKILHKINQINRPTNLKPRKSGLSAQPRLSQALTSIFDLGEDEDLDKHGEGIAAPTGILDDSDFFDEKQRRELIRRKRQETVIRRKLNGGRSPTKRTTHNMITSFGHLPESRLAKGDSHTHISHKKFMRGSLEADRSSMMNRISAHEEEDDDERYIIDVRYLKTIPAFERDYHAYCEDDVLPSKKEREEKLQEEKEMESLQRARLKLEFKITTADERKARERIDSYYSKNSEYATVMGSRKSKRQRTEESMLSAQESKSVFEKEFETGNSRQALQRNTTKNFSKKRTYNPSSHQTMGTATHKTGGGHGNNANDEDYIKPEKMKDFVEILHRIEKPFENEARLDHPEHQVDKMKEFKLQDEYRTIRRADLETYKIGEHNWSGDNVLQHTNANFAVHLVKVSLNKQDFDIWRPGYLGVVHGFRRTLRAIIDSSIFNNFIMISVFLNTLILATEGLISDTATSELLTDFNFCFTVIFTVEMGIKLIALGVFGYVNDKMNLFDAAVVIISLVEATLLTGGGNKAVSAFRTIRLFRTFRVLRVTKLLRSLRYMQLIITVIGRSLKKFMYIFILLFLFVFIYTLLGMQLFGGGLSLLTNTGKDRTRQNFDSFIAAFMTSFQIMTQENWQQILYLAIRSEYVNTLISIFYLISWIWLGNYIFLNLFLAILLDEFTGEEISNEYDELDDSEDDGSSTFSSRGHTLDRSSKAGTGTQKTLSRDSGNAKSISSKMDDDMGEDGDRQIKNQKAEIMICEKSLYFISKQNIIRRICLKIIQHPYFENVILTMIVLSSIKLAFDTYYDDGNNSVIEISDQIDDGLNIFFAVEAGLKIISLGLFVDEGCYLRDAWNKLDMVIVVASILDMSIQAVNLSFIRILRLLRTLRPLRFITHNASMRLIVTALLESFGAILNVILVVLLIWLMFAILAVNIVGSKLGYCNIDTEDTYYGIGIAACASKGGVWANAVVNFDNVFQGLISLFIISTQEGWPDIMFRIADANDASEGPLENNSAAFAYIYFIVFLFVGSYFLVNLFIGVIFLEFTRAQKKENHLKKFLTTEQQNWVIMQRLLVSIKPDVSNVEPKNRLMRKVFRVINSTKFELFIMLIIMLNILLMALSYEGSSDSYNTVLKYINWTFSGIFLGELIAKHVGLGFRRYWANGWNRFDAFVVVASIFDILTDVLQQSFFSFIRIGPQLARVFRVLRVSRLLKLVKQFEGLQKILNTLVFTLPALLNVGALLFLVYFIYSILGTYLFKDIIGGARIDTYANFLDFATAIVTLFRCSTGEDWYLIMTDTVNPTECNPGTYPCGTWAAYPFWLSFIVVCQFIFLNLFILVILQQFEDYHLNDDNPVNTFAQVMENHLRPTWEEFALKHGGTHIHISQLVDFFAKIPAPYGLKGSMMTKIEMSRTLMHLEIPQDFDNMFYYNDIVFAVFRFGFQNKQVDEPNPTQHKYLMMHEEKTISKLNALKKSIHIPSLRRRSTVKEMTKTKRAVGANPIPRILFMGMTMQAWVKYTHNTIEKMNAAKENGVEYVESESDEDDYTFMDPDASEDSRSPRGSDSDEDDDRTKLNGYIKEEEEAESDDDVEKERINTEQQSLIDIDPTERKLKQEEKDYIFNGDISPMAGGYDEENAGPYNAANMALRGKFKRDQRNREGTKITITSHSSIKGGSHFELDKKASASRLTPQRLVKFVEGGDLADIPPKASYSFLEPDMSPKKFESKKSSKSNIEDGEKHSSVINFNINNNVIINNNYFINAAPVAGENPEMGALSPISRETSITIERNINISRGQPQQQASRFGSQNREPILNSRGELIEEGALAIPGSTGSNKDTPTSRKSDSKES